MKPEVQRSLLYIVQEERSYTCTTLTVSAQDVANGVLWHCSYGSSLLVFCQCLPGGQAVSSGRSWAELAWSSGCSGVFSSAWGWLRTGPLSERWPGSSAASPPEEHTHRGYRNNCCKPPRTHTHTCCPRCTRETKTAEENHHALILSFKNCCCEPPHRSWCYLGLRKRSYFEMTVELNLGLGVKFPSLLNSLVHGRGQSSNILTKLGS